MQRKDHGNLKQNLRIGTRPRLPPRGAVRLTTLLRQDSPMMRGEIGSRSRATNIIAYSAMLCKSSLEANATSKACDPIVYHIKTPLALIIGSIAIGFALAASACRRRSPSA